MGGGEAAAGARGREKEAAPDGGGHLREAGRQPSEDAVSYCDGSVGQVAVLSTRVCLGKSEAACCAASSVRCARSLRVSAVFSSVGRFPVGFRRSARRV